LPFESPPPAKARRTFGADEAGRGPILGPMAIAVVALDRSAAISLRRRGVTDSKSFGFGDDARARRAELAARIRERALAHALSIIDVEEIDRHVYRGLLNALERKVVHDLLGQLGACAADRIVCDGRILFSPLRKVFAQLEAVDNGEAAHVSVAAASIVAKDARDRAFAEIAARYEPDFGPVTGGGYLNAATRRFLDAYAARHGGLPPEARRSWGAEKISDDDETLSLF
jgi:ribonuclease HII